MLLDKEAKRTLVPAAASVASLLVTFGLLVGKGDGVDTKIGVILMLITALAQAALFVVGWLQAQGKIMTGTPATARGQGAVAAAVRRYPKQQQYGQQPARRSTASSRPSRSTASRPSTRQPAQPQYGQPTQHQAPAQPQAPRSRGMASSRRTLTARASQTRDRRRHLRRSTPAFAFPAARPPLGSRP